MCLHINEELKRDPTRTKTVRQRFAADARSRYARVARMIRDSVIDNDALGLKVNKALPGERFEFSTDAQKIAGFRQWLEQELARETLARPPAIDVDPSRHWLGAYLAESYDKGVRRARAEMRRIGVDFEQSAGEAAGEVRAIARPVHAQRVGAIFSRSLSELQGINDATAQQVTRVLSEGIAEGLGPRDIARRMVDRVDKIGRHRATLLARTEVIRAHHVATIEEYKRAEIQGVKVQAEFSTAGDSRVCPTCQGLEGNVYTLDDIQGIIPVHPNCRCVALPVVE